jgi:hypothetical protein
LKDERSKNEANINLINKTHDKVKKEDKNKVSTFNRKKLRSLYTDSIDESEKEIK